MTQVSLKKYTAPAEPTSAVMEEVNGVEYLRVATIALPSSAAGGGYDNGEFNLTTGQTNYDVAAGQAALFNNVTTARTVNFRTDKTVTIRLNSTSNAAITVAATDSPFVIDDISVTNIYITNASGDTAAIKILLT